MPPSLNWLYIIKFEWERSYSWSKNCADQKCWLNRTFTKISWSMLKKWVTNWTSMPTWKKTKLAPMSPSTGSPGSKPCGNIANSSRSSNSSIKPNIFLMSKSNSPAIQIPNRLIRQKTQMWTVSSHIEEPHWQKAKSQHSIIIEQTVNTSRNADDRQYRSVHWFTRKKELWALRLRSIRRKGNKGFVERKKIRINQNSQSWN